MLRRGWLGRYLPPVATALVADIAVALGYVWAGLMFVSAALNVVVALNFSIETWSAFMAVYAIASKAGVFLIGYATMRYIAVRRRARATAVPSPHTAQWSRL